MLDKPKARDKEKKRSWEGRYSMESTRRIHWVDEENLQDGVPHKVVVKDSSPMIFARPKSASLTERSLSARRMFSGLMSRWTMFRSCWILVSNMS